MNIILEMWHSSTKFVYCCLLSSDDRVCYQSIFRSIRHYFQNCENIAHVTPRRRRCTWTSPTFAWSSVVCCSASCPAWSVSRRTPHVLTWWNGQSTQRWTFVIGSVVRSGSNSYWKLAVCPNYCWKPAWQQSVFVQLFVVHCLTACLQVLSVPNFHSL